MTENRSRGAMNSGDAPPKRHVPHQAHPPHSQHAGKPRTLDELLVAAARLAPVVPEAEERAVAAFRAARDARAAATAATAPVDDWRSVPPRVRAAWIKVGLGTLVAGLTLGGVAMAAGALPTPFGGPGDKPGPAPSASARQDEAPADRSGPSEPAPSTSGPAAGAVGERPPTEEQERRATCRAYEAAGTAGAAASGRGQGVPPGSAGSRGSTGNADSAARQRLELAAGGADAVAGYCARLLSEHPSQQPSKEPQPGDERKPSSLPTPAALPTPPVSVPTPAPAGQQNGRVDGEAPAAPGLKP